MKKVLNASLIMLCLISLFILSSVISQASIIKVEKKYIEEIAPAQKNYVPPKTMTENSSNNLESEFLEIDFLEKESAKFTNKMAILFRWYHLKPSEITISKKYGAGNVYCYRTKITGLRRNITELKKKLEEMFPAYKPLDVSTKPAISGESKNISPDKILEYPTEFVFNEEDKERYLSYLEKLFKKHNLKVKKSLLKKEGKSPIVYHYQVILVGRYKDFESLNKVFR